MRIERVSLVPVNATIVNGFSSETDGTPTECWAEKKDPKRAEYYSSMAAGVIVEAVFEVSPIDYTDQKKLIHRAEVYRIQRAYKTGPDAVELTCTRR